MAPSSLCRSPARRSGEEAPVQYRCFPSRQISVVFRLLRRPQFVDRPKNYVDPSSNEFDAQVLETTVSFAPTPAPFWSEDAIFVVFSVEPAAHLSRSRRRFRIRKAFRHLL
jgi:hypothetical protein